MGVYATNDELKARFLNNAAVAHLTDTADSGVPDEDVLTEVIGHGEGDIDSYAAMKYKVPLAVADHTSLANIAKSKTLDLAVFYLYVRSNKVPDAIQVAFDKVFEWLVLLAKGEVILPTPDTEETTASRSPMIAFGTSDADDDASERIFNRQTQGAS